MLALPAKPPVTLELDALPDDEVCLSLRVDGVVIDVSAKFFPTSLLAGCERALHDGKHVNSELGPELKWRQDVVQANGIKDDARCSIQTLAGSPSERVFIDLLMECAARSRVDEELVTLNVRPTECLRIALRDTRLTHARVTINSDDALFAEHLRDDRCAFLLLFDF